MATRHTFLNRDPSRDAKNENSSVAVLFQTREDALLVMRNLNGKSLDQITEHLVVRFANEKATKRIKQMFEKLDMMKMEDLKRKSGGNGTIEMTQTTEEEETSGQSTEDVQSDDDDDEDKEDEEVSNTKKGFTWEWPMSTDTKSDDKSDTKTKSKSKNDDGDKQETAWTWNVSNDMDKQDDINDDSDEVNGEDAATSGQEISWQWPMNNVKATNAADDKESDDSEHTVEKAQDHVSWAWNVGDDRNNTENEKQSDKSSKPEIEKSEETITNSGWAWPTNDEIIDKPKSKKEKKKKEKEKEKKVKAQQDSGWAWNVGNGSTSNGHSDKVLMNGSKSPKTTVTDSDSNTDDEKEVKAFRTTRTTSGTLGLGILKTVSNALNKILCHGPNPNGDEMKIDVNAKRIMSFFKEEDVLKFIARMTETEEIYIWQFKGDSSDSNSEADWNTLDMTLSLYLHFLPIDESAVVSMSGSGLRFTIARLKPRRRGKERAVLRYSLLNNGGSDIEYALRRVSSKVEDGVYIPSLWERELVNRSLSKLYLYSIDLRVFEIFGSDKYAVWWNCLKEWVRTDRIVKVSSMESWIMWHSFHLYSNWQCATRRGLKMVRLLYVDSGQADVMRNGFPTGIQAKNHGDGSHRFYLHLEGAYEAAKKKEVNRILLCNVYITEENVKKFMSGKATIKVKSSKLCAYPELCIRVRLQ